MKTPCEMIVWNVVPVIKKEFAKMLVETFNLTQKETAQKLHTTEAAVSRYISGKRGVFNISDKEIMKEIQKSAEKISKEEDINIVEQICKICKLIQKKNIIEGVSDTC